MFGTFEKSTKMQFASSAEIMKPHEDAEDAAKIPPREFLHLRQHLHPSLPGIPHHHDPTNPSLVALILRIAFASRTAPHFRPSRFAAF
jgi:hypothetical protein